MLVLLLQTNTNLEEKIDIKDVDIKRYQIPIKLLRPKTALDLRDKNTEKKKLKRLIQVILLIKVTLMMRAHKII